jgi:hypothetical protein
MYFISTLFHLPPLRFHCVGGWWDRAPDCCDFGIGGHRRSNHSARSHPQILTFHLRQTTIYNYSILLQCVDPVLFNASAVKLVLKSNCRLALNLHWELSSSQSWSIAHKLQRREARTRGDPYVYPARILSIIFQSVPDLTSLHLQLIIREFHPPLPFPFKLPTFDDILWIHIKSWE